MVEPVTFESLKEWLQNSHSGYGLLSNVAEDCAEKLESLEQRLRELRGNWRRDSNANRLRAPNAGSEYEQGAIMGRAKQLEQDANELTALLGGQ